ncbi:MAG TPA: polysaccharide biosynthesis/export family protein [Candidatus Bathyarchaeia archaeon]|nr:polysaccharide biosynthesis/export family protein [Candidatus Bathyarchaeia archaeon]
MKRHFRWLAVLPTVVLLFASTVASVASAQGTSEPSYVVGAEDVLDVQVWDNKDLNQIVFVRPDGKTSLPLVGEIQAAGKTVQELQDYLSAVYSKTVKGAAVTVIIKEIKSRPVYFLGGFGKPGALQLLRSDLTLLQALALVGGVTPAADADKGFVLRKDKVIPVNFTKLAQKGDLTQDVKLEPGDTIVAPLADMVYLQGEVKAPGAVKYTQDLTVVRAITQGGGLTPMSAGGRVDILRGKGEKKERIRVDVDKMMRAPDENLDVLLKPDDIIFVPQRLF